MPTDVFTRDDGRRVRVIPGFRERVLGYRESSTPRADWDDVRYAAAAQKHRRRFERLLDGIRRRRPQGLMDADVLDVGCGGGINALLAATTGARRVVGIDLHVQLLDPFPAFNPARRLTRTVLGDIHTAQVSFVSTDARRMAFADASFDVVISRSAMEHLMPIEAALREMARVVRPGGLVHHAIDPFYWLRGCHKRGVVDLPWAHARLTLDEFERLVRVTEAPEKAAERRRRLETLNRLTIAGWRETIEAGPFDVLAWENETSDFAEQVLGEFPEVVETLLPGVTPADLVCGRINVWLRRRPAS